MPTDPCLPPPPPPSQREHTEEPEVSKTAEMPAATEQSPVAAPLPASSAPRLDGPLPMTMPALLRNPRVRQTQAATTREPSAARTGAPHDSRIVGRRRVRRSENSRLASNPHVSKPTPRDYVLHSNEVRSTFLDAPGERWNGWHAPDYASPEHAAPGFERTSAMRGQFSMSFGEAQRFLRTRLQTSSTQPLRAADNEAPAKAAPKPTLIERLIRIAGREVDAWLQQMVHVPDTQAHETPRVLVEHPDGTPLLVELRRSPTALVWKVDDAYDRLAVHCVARVLECPSFSRTVPAGGMRAGWHAERHTWILNPNPLLRAQPRSRRRVQHRRRSSSTSTSTSVASSTGPPLPGHNPPLATGILQQCIAGLDTPPSTEVEESDGADAESLADSLAESLADSLTVSQTDPSISEEPSHDMTGNNGVRR